MDVDNLPALFPLDQHTAFVVLAVLQAGWGSNGEHKGVAGNGRMPIQLQARLPQIVAEIGACARPAMLNHEKMKIQPILPVRRDEPLVQRKLFMSRLAVGLHIFAKNAVQVAVDGVPNFLFVGHGEFLWQGASHLPILDPNIAAPTERAHPLFWLHEAGAARQIGLPQC